MISKIGQIMLYVDDQDAARTFWTDKLGFEVVSEQDSEGMRWIEVAPQGAATSIVLHNKAVVAAMSPELNLDTPSLMFFSDDLDGLYARLTEQGVTVGELITLPSGRVFNFSDDEEHYFAVMESK